MKSNNFTIFETIKAGSEYLKENNNEILDCFKESLLLMSYALNVSIERIIVNYENKITEDKLNIFNGYIERRAKKEPFAYIINNKEFYSIDFFVDKNVLIPRPDTEILVDESLKEVYRLNNKKINSANSYSRHNYNEPDIKNNTAKNISVIDIGTGSGAIAVSIAKNYKYSNIEIFAADNSCKALNVAKKNAVLNNVENKIKLTYFNILNPNICWYNESSKKYSTDFYNFDIIISNPPYIISSDVGFLSDEVKNYEPCAALDGGIDGLKFYRKIFELFSSAIENSVNSNLTDREFCLLLEIDHRYKEEIKKIYELTFYGKDNKYNNSCEDYKYKINTKGNKNNPINITINFIKDLSGKERVAKINYGKNDN